MSTPDIPTEVSTQIHEHYTSPNSALKSSLKKFSNVVGYPFNLCISWPSLYVVYAPSFPLKTSFIPTVSSFIIKMLESLIEYLEEADEEGGFQEQWLRICEEHPSVYQAGMLVRARNVGRPKCYFARPRQNSVYRWILDLPRGWDKQAFALWEGREIWVLESEPDPEIESPAAEMVAAGGGTYVTPPASVPQLRRAATDEWGLMSGDIEGGHIRGGDESELPSQICSELPKLSSLPPPDQLFSKFLATYNHLLIMHANSASVDIQCTHQSTLELICSYFTKHARINQNKTNLPPYVKIELLKSMWGAPQSPSQGAESPSAQGSIMEPMEMLRFHCREEVNYGARLDHAYIVGFVEGVCGYRLVDGCTGESGRWVFRRQFPTL
ncbi:hypothetical protein L211DRAFT_867859 [Terfezia boudieri ATCC MYA-4762]|uniref:Uncharacterized protein n=1 Tax=Terfezia boudieri ATCC MYA-4762 TaxID=1051890 RepID=A0A3N4LS61_9PEZI|nr:hypothetical protein L211DRAFT_867859 [Terfezia boudieri ATCC MYA-4762]